MKTEKEIKARIEELENYIKYLEKNINNDNDRIYINYSKAELKSLKWVLEN